MTSKKTHLLPPKLSQGGSNKEQTRVLQRVPSPSGARAPALSPGHGPRVCPRQPRTGAERLPAAPHPTPAAPRVKTAPSPAAPPCRSPRAPPPPTPRAFPAGQPPPRGQPPTRKRCLLPSLASQLLQDRAMVRDACGAGPGGAGGGGGGRRAGGRAPSFSAGPSRSSPLPTPHPPPCLPAAGALRSGPPGSAAAPRPAAATGRGPFVCRGAGRRGGLGWGRPRRGSGWPGPPAPGVPPPCRARFPTENPVRGAPPCPEPPPPPRLKRDTARRRERGGGQPGATGAAARGETKRLSKKLLWGAAQEVLESREGPDSAIGSLAPLRQVPRGAREGAGSRARHKAPEGAGTAGV